MSMKKLQIVFFVILLLSFSACSNKDRWEGYVYPDRAKLLIRHSAGVFESLEACESASLEMLKSMNGLEKGFYECGKNCKSNTDYYNRNCDEIIRGNLYKE